MTRGPFPGDERSAAVAEGASPRDRARAIREVGDGVRDAAAVAPSFAIYGAVWGSLASQAGLSVAASLAMSVFVCAGTTQFAVLPLMTTGASTGALLATTYITSLPNYLMAASLAPFFTGLSRPRLALLAHGISNSTYALALGRFARCAPSAAYFAGATLAIYFAWCAGTFAGALLGARLPDPARYGLDFVFPAVFIAIAARAVRSRRDWAIAGVASVLAVATAAWFDGTWHIAVAGLGAPLLGLIPLERSRARHRR
jgi:predicted branched-subunit amino acid permease